MNVAKVEVHWQLDGSLDIFSILHVKSVDSHDPYVEADLEAIALGIDAWWHGGSQAPLVFGSGLYTADVVLLDVTVTRIKPTLGVPYVLPVGFAGTAFAYDFIVGDPEVLPLPPQVCWLIGLRTSIDTRRGRGRLYLPSTWIRGPLEAEAPLQAQSARGEVRTEVRDLLGQTAGTLAAEIFEAGTSGEYVWCVFSEVADDSYAITHFEVSNQFRTQRRRALRPGLHSAYGLSGDPA